MDRNYFRNKYKADSVRLPDWDYSWAGYYFFTICTKDRQDFFGEIRKGIMGLNDLGCIAWRCWNELPKHFKMCVLNEFIVMPNHLHGIIYIENYRRDVACNVSTKCVNGRMSRISPKSGSLSTIIRSFKSACTKTIHENSNFEFQWQPRFHDHIVRIDSESLEKIRYYIRGNPARWENDENNIDKQFSSKEKTG